MCRRSELLPLPVFPTTARWVVRRSELIVTRQREATPSTIANPSESPETSRSPWRRSRALFQILAKKWSNAFGMGRGGSNYSEVSNDDFLEPLPGDLLRGVMEFDFVNLEGGEDRADLGHVVQAQYELTLYPLQPFRHLYEIVVGKVVTVERPVVVGRIEIKESGRPIIPPEHVLIRQILDLHPRHALSRLLKEFRQTFGVEGRRLGNVRTVVAPAHEARIGVLREVEVARSTLHVGQRIRIGAHHEIEPAATRHHEAHGTDQLVRVGLGDPEEVHHVTVKVIDDLDRGRWLAEKYLRAATERLDIGGVRREHFNDLLGKCPLAADVTEGADHE